MNFRCRCGDVHEFSKFETFPTSWGGRTSLYEATCLKKDKHMILVSNTYPPSVFLLLCPVGRIRKFIRLAVLFDWDEFMYCDWIHSGQIRTAR